MKRAPKQCGAIRLLDNDAIESEDILVGLSQRPEDSDGVERIQAHSCRKKQNDIVGNVLRENGKSRKSINTA